MDGLLPTLLLACAPGVDVGTARALVEVESAYNPHAIGVVGAALERQPRSRAEALATTRALRAGGWNFSAGLAQINRKNFARLGLTDETAFDPCANLAAMQTALVECFGRAGEHARAGRSTLGAALSCYYSGNFNTGFKDGYVRKVVEAHMRQAQSRAQPRSRDAQ